MGSNSPGFYKSVGTVFDRLRNPNPLLFALAQEQKNKIEANIIEGTITPPSVSFIPYSVSAEDAKRMYAFISMGVNGSSNPDWLGMNSTVLATFQGTPTTGTRAYPWEVDPANPNVSSPWHNTIYEMCVDIYNWGTRAFFFYMPFGTFDNAYFLTPEIFKRTYTSAGENYEVPARWKGFSQAIKALLEGNLRPEGKTPMTDPCNVCIYHPSNRGYAQYRAKSNVKWDSLGSTTQERDLAYYEYLDSHINTIIQMKSNDLTKGRLSIILDATSPSATPNTVHLWRSVTDYRSDALELSDWYVFNKLKEANIDVYYEARGRKTTNIATIGAGAVAGDTANIQWAQEAFTAEEYWLWYSNPSNTDVGFDNYQQDSDSPAIMRLMGSNFPIPANGDPNRDPFHPNLTVVYDDVTRVFEYGENYLYTPHWAVWQIYAMSDNFRKYYNKRTNTGAMKGIKLTTENSIAYLPEWLIDGDFCISVYDGVQDPTMKYWRLNSSIVHTRPMFNAVSFKANPSTYNSGFWTQEGKDYWDQNVRKTSFNSFINFLQNYSLNHAPLNTPQWKGAVYGTQDDVLNKNVIVLI